MPPLAPQPLRTPSPDVFDDVTSGGIKPEDDTLGPPSAHADILNTFDPLEHHEEQRAREAWASAEGHPLPRARAPTKARSSATGVREPLELLLLLHFRTLLRPSFSSQREYVPRRRNKRAAAVSGHGNGRTDPSAPSIICCAARRRDLGPWIAQDGRCDAPCASRA
jgi:hypothetical protein